MTKPQVDTLKGIAILQVVIVHVLSLFPEVWWFQNDVRSLALVVVDQLCRISIPLFIFLSWYGLSRKYKGQSVELLPFLKSRILKLLPLYLIWAVGIWLMMQFVPSWRFNNDIPLTTKLMIGQSDYHLYFVPLIIILYSLYAIYSFLPKSLRLAGLGFIGLVTWWWYGYLPTFRVGFDWIQPDQIQYLMPLTWLWYAWLGGVAADFNLSQKLSKPLIKRVLLVLSILSTLWLIRDAYLPLHTGQYYSVLLAMQFTRKAVLFFATIVILFILSTVGHWGEKKTVLTKVGIFSFFVFLAHTSLIRLFPAQYLYPIPLEEWLVGGAITTILLILSSFFMI